MKAVSDRIVIQLLASQEQTSGGLYIAPTARSNNIARVVKVGPGKMSGFTGEPCPQEVSVGDVVMFQEGTALAEFEVKGEKFLVISGDAVFIVFEEGEYE